MIRSSADHNVSVHRIVLACLAVGAVLTACLPSHAMDAPGANALVDGVIAQLAKSKGVVSIPNCGNGQLALAFLQRSGMRVHAQDANTANVASTHALVAAAGFSAPRFYADRGGFSVLPYVDRFVTAVVITNLTDADLANVPYAEVQRVLSPGGVAWVGRATSEGTGITQTALQNWINAASKTRSTAVVSSSNGTWAVISGRELSGVDVWCRHDYDASGVRYSKDSVAAFPWLPQAKIKPYRKLSGTEGAVVTSGGRMYYISVDPMVNNTTVTNLRAYDIYNGELLWTRNASNEQLPNLTSGDAVIAYDQDVYLNRNGTYLRLNGLTGAELGTVSSVPSRAPAGVPMPDDHGAQYFGCGPMYTASINATYASTGVYGWDFLENKQRVGHFYKPPCRIMGTVISNGFLINSAPTCGCGSSRMQGTHVDAAARSFPFDKAAASNGSDRLEQGPAFSDLSAQVMPDNLDWATHRATVAHNGALPVSVPNTSTGTNLMWNCIPASNYVTTATTMLYDYKPDLEPTPPAVVQGRTYFGGSDGYLRCISNSTGRMVWSYPTGGRIFATPTVWNGCVYVGSADGHAYCIEAHTGRLVWRFRAAPADMRANIYGDFSSPWPVLTGVMIVNGNAFFCAGMQSEYGTHVYSVNARTGALVWQNNTSSTWLNASDRLGVTACGYMTAAKNRVYLSNSVAGVASFNLTTGALDPLPTYNSINLARTGYPSISVSRGREIGVINDAYLVHGGRLMYSDHNVRSLVCCWPTQQFFAFNQLDANGASTGNGTALNSATTVAPAWDGDAYYQCMYNGDQCLRQFSLSSLTTKLGAATGSNVSTAYSGGWGAGGSFTNEDDPYQGMVNSASTTPSWWPASSWVRSDIHISAVAIASNAIVAAYCKATTMTGTIGGATVVAVPEAATWYVGVLNKSNGATLWEKALPDVGTNLKGEPVLEGLAIDRNGYIIVVQRNGNVLCYGGGSVSVAGRTPPVDTRTVSTLAEPALAVAAFTTPAGQPSASSRTGYVASPTLPSLTIAPPSIVIGDSPATTAQTASQSAAFVPDTADMITRTDGARVHAYPPSIRAGMIKATVGEPADMTWRPDQPCLRVASATASSARKATGAHRTIDRDLRTRWSAEGAGNQWIMYDLGSACEVSSVSLVWHSSVIAQTSAAIELSDDGRTYRSVDSWAIEGKGGNETLRSFPSQEARYVRVMLISPEGKPMASLQEVGIHGAAAGAMATGMK